MPDCLYALADGRYLCEAGNTRVPWRPILRRHLSRTASSRLYSRVVARDAAQQSMSFSSGRCVPLRLSLSQTSAADRLLWVWFSRVWTDWRSSLVIVKPETVVGWHRNAFSRLLRVEDPETEDRAAAGPARCQGSHSSHEQRESGLGRAAHGELLKLGVNIGETSVSQYLVRNRKPPSQTWRAFFDNHVSIVPWTSSPSRRSGFRSSMSSSCLRTSAGASFTSRSQHIQLQSGLHSSSGSFSVGQCASRMP